MSWLHVVIDVPAEQHAASADFWGRVLGWPAGAAWPDHPELRSFEPLDGSAYVHLQQIEGPPRVHVDVESAAPDDLITRAVDLGAVLVSDSGSWRTLRSPGGLPFCVLAAAEHAAPAPVAFPDGHRGRLVQVCIDSPHRVHDTEVSFWRAVLGGRWVPSTGPEFAGKWHDDAGSPLQLLFQELDEDDGPVRAHLDLGTDDLPAEVARLLDLGADDVGRGRGRWHVVGDVTGRLFCATANAPAQLRHRDLGQPGPVPPAVGPRLPGRLSGYGDVMTSIGRGLVAGAFGTLLLNAATYVDMAVTGRSASNTPGRTVKQLAESVGLHPPTDEARLDAYGALGGMAVGLALGVLASAIRSAGVRLPAPLGAVAIGGLAMVASDGGMVANGITDPREWTAADWTRDVVPHLAYGVGVRFALDRLDVTTNR